MTYKWQRGVAKTHPKIYNYKIAPTNHRKIHGQQSTAFRTAEKIELSAYGQAMQREDTRIKLFNWFEDEVKRMYDTPLDYKIDYSSKSGRVLDTVQRQLVDSCVNTGRVLLDVEVGVGKTLVALVSAKNVLRELGGKCLAICEKKHIGYWQNEAAIEGVECDAFNFEYFIKVASGRAPEFDISSYECVVIDESHYRANLETQATKAMLKVLEPYSSHTFCLTATPVRNTILDYLVQLKFIKHPLGLLDPVAFQIMFKIALGFQPDIALFKRLTHKGIRKATLKDAGIDIKVNLIKIDVDLPQEYRQEYDHLERSTKILEVRYGNRILPISTNKKQMEVLCASAKVDFTVSLLKKLNSEGKSAVVISNYNEKVLDIMGDKLKTGVFKAGNRKKAQLLEDFTAGKTQYLLAQRKIAQSGLNLQNCSTIILNDLHYSLDFIIQSIGRVKRRGQKEASVDIYIPFCRDTGEYHIWDVLQKKWEDYTKTC